MKKTVSLLFNPSAKTDRITAEYERKNFIKEMIYTVEGNSRQSELRQQMVNYAMKFVGVSKYYDNEDEQKSDQGDHNDARKKDIEETTLLLPAAFLSLFPVDIIVGNIILVVFSVRISAHI